jgi:methionyl-tRNA formyltransferase
LRAVFWGTPEFATPSLRALLGEGHEVVAVVTQPDRPVGRHHSSLAASEVKLVAESEGIPVLQPESARSPEFLSELKAIAPEVSVVVAFGQILPSAAINLPEHGTINVHASLLPLLRGAAPIQAAIRDGLDVTGVTIMQMVPKLDAGPIILQNESPILPDETYGELQLRLSELGAMSLVQALALISLGRAELRDQDESLATYAPRITRADARIDWSKDAETVARVIRAFDPKPGAFTTRGSVEVRVYGARPVVSRNGPPGAVLGIDEGGMLVGCGAGDLQQHGALRIAYVHPSGRRRMAALDWAQGRGIAVGDTLGTGG